ncbi:hypothetical protein [Cupriavidus basilensis]|uniref:hypothetical protein n=1 Tax=Cupriavidus basilensis TaxID=68895 RepID=UPI0039F71432
MANKDAPTFDFELVVIHAFGDYERGTRISDPATIAAVMAGDNAHHCHKVAKPQ